VPAPRRRAGRHVARNLQVDRARARQRGVEHAGDSLRRALQVVQARAVDGDLLEEPPLRVDLLDLVVQQQAAAASCAAGAPDSTTSGTRSA
jgi:hypothetical protein